MNKKLNKTEAIMHMLNGGFIQHESWLTHSYRTLKKNDYLSWDNVGFSFNGCVSYEAIAAIDFPEDGYNIYVPTLTWEQAYEEMKKGKICQMVGTNRICRWNNKLETKSQENEWIPEIYLSVNSAYSSNWQLVEDETDKKYSILDILKRYENDRVERKYSFAIEDETRKEIIVIKNEEILTNYDEERDRMVKGEPDYRFSPDNGYYETQWQEVIE